ncbi:hypothetical protein [Pilimelia columellifera]
MRLLHGGLSGVTEADIDGFAAAVVERVAPGELLILEAVAADFRRDPSGVLGAGLRPPVRLGAEFVSVAAVAVYVASMLGGVLTNAAGNLLADGLSEPTRRLVQAILRRRGVAVEASDSQDVSAGLGPPVGGGVEVRLERRLSVGSDAEREITEVVTCGVATTGLSGQQTTELTEAVLEVLRGWSDS